MHEDIMVNGLPSGESNISQVINTLGALGHFLVLKEHGLSGDDFIKIIKGEHEHWIIHPSDEYDVMYLALRDQEKAKEVKSSFLGIEFEDDFDGIAVNSSQNTITQFTFELVDEDSDMSDL